IIIDLEDEVVSLLEKEKANLETIESLKSKGFESSDNVISESENQNENDCQVVEKECDNVENSKVTTLGILKLSVSPISITKTSCASNGVENTLSIVRRPKHSGVMWMRNGSSNTVKAELSSVNHSNLKKNVKRYSRKNLMACNNSDTFSAFDCNNARNALCNARMNASVDVNDLFVFDDFRQYAGQNAGNLAGYNDIIGNQNQIGNGNLVAVRAEGNAAGKNGNQIRCYNCRGEVNANCILMANLQQASTSGTQTDSAPVYDTDGSAEVHENCNDNEIFNMFTQEGQYTELLEPIPESH
nr:hypothetical protein [Tanacetum cinerariifolium]